MSTFLIIDDNWAVKLHRNIVFIFSFIEVNEVGKIW